MIKSMTGYGKADGQFGGGRLTAELRSVNHRYAEVTVKVPRALMAFEHDLKRVVQETVRRGKVDLFIQLEAGMAGATRPTANLPLARAYHQVLASIQQELGLPGGPDLAFIAAQRDVIVMMEDGGAETTLDDLVAVVRRSVVELDAMRMREGAALVDDLKQRRAAMALLRDKVEQRAPEVVREQVVRLKERVAQLAGDHDLDPQRLAQEVALMADRADISEELVRLRSHFAQFDETLSAGESVGRKLDFLIQEMNREVNTIGSKANDAEIAAIVVEMKAELEKIREQVQNIE